jgi:hypothetical protein
MGPGRSEGRGELYAFPGRDRTVCLFLLGQGGGGLTPGALEHTRSAKGMFLPGYPGQMPAAAGIVADNVRSVEVTVAGRTWSPQIVNNSFYTDLPGVTADRTVSMEARFADGSTTTRVIRPGRRDAR